MYKGCGEAAEVVSGVRGAFEHGSGLWGLWETFVDGNEFQVPWGDTTGIGQQLAGGVCKPMKGAKSLGAALLDTQVVGGIPPDFWDFLQDVGAGDPPIQRGYLGNVP